MKSSLPRLIEQNYNCKVFSLLPKRREVFLCRSNRGEWFIKRYPGYSTARWVTSLCSQLQQKGFHRTIEYVYSRDHHPFFSDGKYVYTVMKKIEGRHASYYDSRDLVRTISCLADFHRVARGIKGGPAPGFNRIPLLDKWKKRTRLFEQVVERLQLKEHPGQLERWILEMAPGLLRDAYEVIDILQRSPLDEKVRQAVQEQRVAHRDLAPHNFLLSNRHCYLIDFDTAMYDAPLVDLLQFMGRIMGLQGWDFNTFAALLQVYQKRMPLHDEDRALLYTLLRYPDDFMREVNGCFHDNSGYKAKNAGYVIRLEKKNWQRKKEFFAGSHHFLSLT